MADAAAPGEKALGRRKVVAGRRFHQEDMICPNVLSTNLIPAQKEIRACVRVHEFMRTHAHTCLPALYGKVWVSRRTSGQTAIFCCK